MTITYVPFYPSDWLAGTRALSDAETGVYITLIARMYETAGPVERDDRRLSRLCGCKSVASFKRSLEFLIDDGKITEDEGFLFNFRVKIEIENVIEISSKSKRAAEARWNKKRNKNNGRGHADAMRTHMRPDMPNGMPEGMPDACQPKVKYKNTLSASADREHEADAENPPEISIRDQLWDRGVPYLRDHNITDRNARSFIGKCLKDHPPDAVFNAFVAASKSRTQDPVPFITATLQERPQNGQPDSQAISYAAVRIADQL